MWYIIFSEDIVLIFLLMLLNPIANLFRLNKKKISNPIYHLIIIVLTNYISITCIRSLKVNNQFLFFDKDNSSVINDAINFFGERFLYIIIALIFTLLISFVFNKEIIKTDKDKSKLMLFIILITSSFLHIIFNQLSKLSLNISFDTNFS